MSGWRRRGLEISIALILADLLLITAWISARLRFNSASFSPAEVTPFVVALGVLVALVTFSGGQRRQESQDYLESASDLLEKAYRALADEKDDLGRPLNSRLNWLTAARLITTAQQTSQDISMTSHQLIWVARREYWRGQLYDLIRPADDFPSEYFAEKPEHMRGYVGKVRAPLSESSLAVLYRFIKWPEGLEDPLRNQDKFTEQEIQHMIHFGPKGLGLVLEKVRALSGK